MLEKIINRDIADSDVKLELTLLNDPLKKYEVKEFLIEFSQEVDHRGQPQHETWGGCITFLIHELPGKLMNKWMFDSTLKMSGEFNFKRTSQSGPLKVIFHDAYCTNYVKNVGMGGASVRLTILPHELLLNDVPHLKNWEE